MNPQSPGQTPFYGKKISIQGVPVTQATDAQLLYKDDYNQSLETYYGNGKAVVELGKLPAGGYGIRFPDTNGIGIAQFGQFPDGSTSLKIAQAGVEVATAPNSELIFNSNQDIFKIVDKFTTPFSFTSGSGASVTSIIVTHNLGYQPLIFSSVSNLTVNAFISSPITVPIPHVLYGTTSGVSAFVPVFFIETAQVTNTIVDYSIGLFSSGEAIAGTFTTYILQESIT